MSDLTEFREHKDHFMGHDPDSPLTDAQRRSFQGLSYFDETPSARATLEVSEFDDEEVVEMQTSTGDVASYLRFGKIGFIVDGTPVELTIYKDTHGGELFLPFADATSGEETYPSGRYLDIQRLPDGKVLVDFNYAYSPYCAYNEQWSCPLTPFENRLKVHVRAGEKNFK